MNKLEFFTNKYQLKIREVCQNNSERFEECLEQYHMAFIKEVRNLRENYAKESTDFPILRAIGDNEVDKYFNKIKKIYIKWIDSDISQAYELMKELVEELGLLNKSISCKGKIFFRARKTREELTRHDIFHIPYNKRSLISNQRFSLTGQPIVYLGASVIGVKEELLNNEKEIQLSISTFEIVDDFDIIDFRNNINKKALSFETIDNNKIKFDSFKDDDVDYNKELGIMILEGCCSFGVKRQSEKEVAFYEEYVLPQLLAQVLKHNKKDGVVYSSTKYDKYGLVKSDVSKESMFFPNDNLALFTNYKYNKNSVDDYDESLYEKLKISVPLYWNNIGEQYTLNDIDKLCHQLQITRKDEISITNEEQINMFKGVEIDNCSYWDTSYGKKQLYLLYNTLYNDAIKGEILQNGNTNL